MHGTLYKPALTYPQPPITKVKFFPASNYHLEHIFKIFLLIQFPIRHPKNLPMKLKLHSMVLIHWGPGPEIHHEVVMPVDRKNL